MPSFKKIFGILNASLFLVIITYLPDVIFAKLTTLHFTFLAVLIIIPLKIFIHSGILGTLTELISHEHLTLRASRFKVNAKAFWPYYLLITGLPFLTHFTFTVIGHPPFNMDIYTFFAFITPPILFIMQTIIIKKKYLLPLNLPKRKIPITAAFTGTMLGLFILNLLIYFLPQYINQHFNLDLSRITYFFYCYSCLFFFVYFADQTLNQYPEVRQQFQSEKEIYLISPLGGGLIFHLGSLFMRLHTPFFVAVRALTPKNYTFREFNRVPWQEHYYTSGKLVAITCFTSNCGDAYRIARKFRKHGSTVIIGGPHVTYLPDEALEYADSVVCGELESVWPKIIEDYEQGTLQKKYIGTPDENCHQLIYEELLNSPPEVIKDFLETSRGCKFKCHFCTVPALSQGKLRHHNIGHLLELIKKVKTKYNHIVFIDNNIYSDPAYARELFAALKDLHIKWSTQCTIDIAKNTELLNLAKKSGCRSLLIGFEIPEGSFEKGHGGKLAMVGRYKEYAKIIKKHGIKIKAQFIFGFESDTFAHLFKFWKFCLAIRPTVTAISILTPFPGSQLYYTTIQKDQILNLNWRNYGGQTLVYNHPRMNTSILGTIYPAIHVLFFLTTSTKGLTVLLFIIAIIYGVI